MSETVITPTEEGMVTHHGAMLEGLLAQVKGDWAGMTTAERSVLVQKVLEALLTLKVAENADS